MAFLYLKTATCYFNVSDTSKQFASFELACEAAERYVGNRVYTRPFKEENTRLYGPGDGSTTVMVRQDVHFE